MKTKQCYEHHKNCNGVVCNHAELLLYSQGFDLVWRLRDTKGAHIGSFASPALVKQWCDDNGYRCRQSTVKDKLAALTDPHTNLDGAPYHSRHNFGVGTLKH